MLSVDTCFSGVYTPAYSRMFAAPRAATSGEFTTHSSAVPATPLATPKPAACSTEILPLGSGRVLVRAMRPSVLVSYTWLNVLADAEHRKVPTPRAATEAPVLNDKGAPASRNPPAALPTTSADSRALDSSL